MVLVVDLQVLWFLSLLLYNASAIQTTSYHPHDFQIQILEAQLLYIATTGGGFLVAGSHGVGRLINFNLKIKSVDCEPNIYSSGG